MVNNNKETRGPKGHCCSPEYNERVKKYLWTLDQGEAPIESRKAEVSFIHSMIRWDNQ